MFNFEMGLCNLNHSRSSKSHDVNEAEDIGTVPDVASFHDITTVNMTLSSMNSEAPCVVSKRNLNHIYEEEDDGNAPAVIKKEKMIQ